MEDEGSSGNPVVSLTDCPDGWEYDPRCGDGICDEDEFYCPECRSDCGVQDVDEGFRINGSLDDIVYLCSKSFTITPKKTKFQLGVEWEYDFCWLSLFTWGKCPKKYINYTIDIIKCNGDMTESDEGFTYGQRFRQDGHGYNDNEFLRSLSFSDNDYDFIEGQYYKVVFKTYTEEDVWISSYRFIYVLPPSTFSSTYLTADIPYIQKDIVIEDQTIASLSGDPGFQFIAKNSIKIGSGAKVFSNFHASIDPNLSFDCNTLKSAEISVKTDTSYIFNESDKTSSLVPDLSNQINSEEFVEQDNNISIFPNPASNIVTVEIKGVNCNKLVVRDISGNEVASYNDFSDDNQEINISSWPKGVYLIEVSSEGRIMATQKLIKE